MTFEQPVYLLDDDGAFVVENYNMAKPFASFFPGIAGAHGIPMWLFYVNRGQCVCSMGIEDKENPIMEFLPANWAWQLTGTQGFRTFLKILDGGKSRFYEPFQTRLADTNVKRIQRMKIHPAQLTLEEENRTLGLRIAVDYFNVPEDSYAGLVRILRIRNLGRKTIRLEGLDGLPMIIPHGVNDWNLKHMRRLVESFVEVTNCRNRVPYFKGKVKQEDKPEIVRIKAGNFYMGWETGPRGARVVEPVVDPVLVFDRLTDYSYPARFLARTPYRPEGEQMVENRLPCALGYFSAVIQPGGAFTYTSIIGHVGSEDAANKLLPIVTRRGYVETRRRENEEIIERLTQNSFVNSASRSFDLYARQNFLDNVLRGGLPVSLNGGATTTTLYLYSRKHGDLERDYNQFRLSATNYSQGNGNFRDVNQNRRSDLFFNPDVQESNVEHFYNMIQLDGFNPLVVKPIAFSVKPSADLDVLLGKAVGKRNVGAVRKILENRFTPGQLLGELAANGIRLKTDADIFMGELLARCGKYQESECDHAFWTDHWVYNLDLLENYLGVYPERLRLILLEKKIFTFFDSPYRVQPRADKYVIWEGNLMQLNAVVQDPEKVSMIKSRGADGNVVFTRSGHGEVYRTTLVNKLISLIVNKLASLDPEGVGIEMEADRPNWYDALNGLPGQLGSSICETLELKRTVMFLLQALDDLKLGDDCAWPICTEIAEFLEALRALLGRPKMSAFEFWDKSACAKERYREITRLGISGNERSIRAGELRRFLKLALGKLDHGLDKAWDRKRGVINTYFINKVVKHEEIKVADASARKTVKRNARGLVCFRARKFRQVPLPLFLEGPVHWLKISRDPAKARKLAGAIRASGLYDRKLKMYKVNESIENQPMEIGRTRTFARGWLENESVWLHMEYKYMLELLRCGLYEEFYRDFKNVLVPFMDPAIYGRSILENSSFIVSSANPDPSIHGNGFMARLSGSTAEFVNILLLMNVGDKPFTLDARGEMQVQFKPALPGWLFTRTESSRRYFDGKEWIELTLPANTYSFTFLGSILIVYHNPRRRNTFGPNGVAPMSMTLTRVNGETVNVQGSILTGDLARQIRARDISRVDVALRREGEDD